jgi:hypothetical protein
MAVDKKTPVSHFMEEHNDNRYQSDDSPSSIVDVYNDQVWKFSNLPRAGSASGNGR